MWRRTYRCALGLATFILAGLVGCSGVVPNNPPDPPVAISVPSGCRADSTYSLLVTARDLDGDSVAVMVAWDDGDSTGWSGFASSLETVALTHQWPAGTFELRGRAQDRPGALSPWSGLGQVAVRDRPAYPDSIVAELDLPMDGVWDCEVSTDGACIYYCFEEGGICAVRTSDNRVPMSLRLPGNVEGIDLSPDEEHLYACCGSLLYFVETAGFSVVDSMAIGWWLTDVCASEDGDRLYVTRSVPEPRPKDDSLYVVDLGDTAVETVMRIPDGWHPQLHLEPNGNLLYVACGDTLLVVRTTDVTMVAAIECDCNYPPAHLPTRSEIYADGPGCVVVYDSDSHAAVDTIAVQPGWLAALPGDDYVVSMCIGQAAVISTHERRIVGCLPSELTCGCGTTIAALPGGSRLYVTEHHYGWVYGLSQSGAGR